MREEKFALNQIIYSINNGVEEWKVFEWAARNVSMIEMEMVAINPNDGMRKVRNTYIINSIQCDVNYYNSISAMAYCYAADTEDMKVKMRDKTFTEIRKYAITRAAQLKNGAKELYELANKLDP